MVYSRCQANGLHLVRIELIACSSHAEPLRSCDIIITSCFFFQDVDSRLRGGDPSQAVAAVYENPDGHSGPAVLSTALIQTMEALQSQWQQPAAGLQVDIPSQAPGGVPAEDMSAMADWLALSAALLEDTGRLQTSQHTLLSDGKPSSVHAPQTTLQKETLQMPLLPPALQASLLKYQLMQSQQFQQQSTMTTPAVTSTPLLSSCQHYQESDAQGAFRVAQTQHQQHIQSQPMFSLGLPDQGRACLQGVQPLPQWRLSSRPMPYNGSAEDVQILRPSASSLQHLRQSPVLQQHPLQQHTLTTMHQILPDPCVNSQASYQALLRWASLMCFSRTLISISQNIHRFVT